VVLSLSDAEKDALILSLQATVASQQATIVRLEARIAQLEAMLAADSTKSNRPPSSDGLSKGPPKPRSLRQKSGKTPAASPVTPAQRLYGRRIPIISSSMRRRRTAIRATRPCLNQHALLRARSPISLKFVTS